MFEFIFVSHLYEAVLNLGVPGNSTIAIALGMSHTCIIVAGGGVKCWGDNWAGKLGIGSNIRATRPMDVAGAWIRPPSVITQ